MKNNRIKIAFIKPQDPNLTGNNIILSYFEGKDTFQPGSMNIYYLPDLTLLNLAGRVSEEYEPVHIDEDVDGLVTGEENFDLVYINAKSQQSPRAYEISSLFMEKNIPVVIGGTHVTAVPNDAEGKATSILLGEEDFIFDMMLRDFEISGKWGIKKIYESHEFSDLGLIPPPAYQLLDYTKYSMIPVQATRGCPHNCKFCFSTKFCGSRLRHKPVENVIKEIRLIKNIEQNPNLFFMDDNMLSDRKYSKELLVALKKENIRWCTFTDISFAHDDELLDLLPRSGCSEVLIGFETVTPDSMNQVSDFKLRELKSYEDSIKKIQNAGIGIIGSFVVGFDSDTLETFDSLFDFIDRNMLHEISISILTPYPGTDLFNKFKEDGRLTNHDYGRYSDLSWNVNFSLKNMTEVELKKGITDLLDRVYSKEMFIKRMKHFKELVKRRLD